MAQPGVAREPSMEEILASIRKIIESNDPGAEKGLGRSMPPLYDEEDEEISLTVDEERAGEFYAANDQPAPVARPQPVAAAPDSVARNVSLADLAARVRATVEREEFEPAVPVAELRPSAPIAESPLMPSRLASLRSPMPPLEPAPVAPRIEPQVDVSAPVAHQPAMAVETVPSTELLSAQSGALVAKSFGELAAAVDGQQRRSLDEMAEEMLRPMLREWLDDNLPTLVERLVREEIERVARGPRR